MRALHLLKASFGTTAQSLGGMTRQRPLLFPRRDVRVGTLVELTYTSPRHFCALDATDSDNSGRRCRRAVGRPSSEEAKIFGEKVFLSPPERCVCLTRAASFPFRPFRANRQLSSQDAADRGGEKGGKGVRKS